MHILFQSLLFATSPQGILEVIIKGINPNAHEVLDNDICAWEV
jgi:hypothetical protein